MQKDRAETFMMNCKRQVIRKPLGPIGRMEMDKGAFGAHKLDGEGSTITSDMQVVGSHRSNGHGDRPHRFRFHRSNGERVPQVHVAWRKDRANTFITNSKHHG